MKIILLKTWIVSRLLGHLKAYPTSLVLNYNWSFGSLTGFFLALQLVSGVFLSFHYVAETGLAFESVDYIMREVNFGWLMRYIHSNSASFFFIVMYIHIFRSIFYKSYIKPLDKVWVSGVILLLLSIIVAFIGYVLPWGQMSFWGATVITNLASALPFVGTTLVHWLWGGTTIDNATLTRFYSLHYLLAIVLTLLVFLHIFLLHRAGSSNPTGISVKKEYDYFNRSFGYKDLHSFLWVLLIFVYVITYYPDALGHPDNYIQADPMSTPSHIVPEWYFLPFYAILRSIDNKFLGVAAMLLSIFILLFLPYSKRIIKDSTFLGLSEYTSHLFFYLVTISIIMLGFIGGLPAEYPFIQYGKFFTIVYFLSFFINYTVAYWENWWAKMMLSPSYLENFLKKLRRISLFFFKK